MKLKRLRSVLCGLPLVPLLLACSCNNTNSPPMHSPFMPPAQGHTRTLGDHPAWTGDTMPQATASRRAEDLSRKEW